MAGATGTPGPVMPRYDTWLEGTVAGPAELIGNTGAALIGNSGAGLVGNSGGALAGNSGGALAGNSGGAYRVAGDFGGANRVAGLDPILVEGAVVYLTTPDEELYRDPEGKVVATTTDATGHYRLPAVRGRPLVVTAVLTGNRRLVGYTFVSEAGTASVDVSLESTYTTEFLRYQARSRARTMADYDLARFRTLTGLTARMLEAGTLSATPDINISEIPNLVQTYLLAFAPRDRAVSDAWAELLGYRPLAVSTLEDSGEPGLQPTAVTVLPNATPAIHVAAMDTAGYLVGTPGALRQVTRGLAARGHVAVWALAADPAGRLVFAERVDQFRGGAVDRSGPIPAIRLYVHETGGGGLSEEQLPVPAEIAQYAADGSQTTAVEPGGLAWNDGRLYMSDFESGLVYEYTRPAGGNWVGTVFAGRVEDGRPIKGFRAGSRRSAAFGGLGGLAWHGGGLYVADPDNHVIRRIAADGQVEVVAGTPGRSGAAGDGGDPLSATLAYPKAIAFDAAGRLFIADGDNHRVRVVADGVIRTIVGGGDPAFRDGDAARVTVGQIASLAFDTAGNLLFTDEATSRVRRLWLEWGL